MGTETRIAGSSKQAVEHNQPPAKPKTWLSEKRLEEFRRILVASAEEQRRTVKSTREALVKNTSEARGRYGIHPELGLVTEAVRVDNRTFIVTNKFLEAIERALKRIEEGTYGICCGCEKPIPEERLDSVPASSLCIGCKNKKESTN